jgi:acetyltransferase-like isoleucine patch superfamily enzyme
MIIFIYRLFRLGKRKCLKLVSSLEKDILTDNIRKQGGSVGEGFILGNSVTISGLSKLTIGNNVSIGTGSFIRAEGGLNIGSNVIISRNLVLYTTSHNHHGSRLPFDATNNLNPVIIEDNVWIGMDVTIAPGTVIREGAIIALGSRVWGEVKKGEIVGTQKFKTIGFRNLEHYESLKSKQKIEDNKGRRI